MQKGTLSFRLGIVWMMALLFLCGKTAIAVNASPFSKGDTFHFGRYEQDNKSNDGIEPIEWIVLDVEEDKALLISQNTIDMRKYHDRKENTIWKDSSIRFWLNKDFYLQSFTDQERAVILETDISNAAVEGYGEWDTKDSNNTRDRIFLLSYAEIQTFFNTKEERKANATEYVKSIKSGNDMYGRWWLRSPGAKEKEAAFINNSGSVKSESMSTLIGVRPALWIDISADLDSLPYGQYKKALELASTAYNEYGAPTRYVSEEKLDIIQTSEQYGKAAEILEKLGDYNNSPAIALDYRYRQAQLAAEEGDYETAIETFDALGDYEDSYMLCKTARYDYAVSCQEKGDYEKAARLFAEGGQYLDTMDRLKECYKNTGIQIRYFSDGAVNTGLDNGYKNEGKISKDDPHFGWELGRFLISGHTRVADEENDKGPVFIKTLGDEVTLWFELDQDIDALNANKSLSVAADKDGTDDYFEITKRDFGRGFLICQQTDYQNKKLDPICYNDFLSAKGSMGADTKVILSEEGDYEVALDYEIREKGGIGKGFSKLLGSRNDYKIKIRFRVRNGNCMVYPKDLKTNSELSNKAITENGFYLDLAKSRYLDINVKYSVITKGISGIVEDVRFNRPAKDGDWYKSEGIYTFTVSNRYTGETTVKTIFVGSNELLEEYIQNGFSEALLY